MKVTTDASLFGAWIRPPYPLKGELRVLDIGTGTGLLSLMFAQKNPSAFIDAIEIDEESYAQAQENVAASQFGNRIKVIHQDVKKLLSPRKYDVIISNPPFYENEVTSVSDRKNVAHHHSGLSLRQLLLVINSNLSNEGQFFLLLPYKRNKEIKSALFKNDLSIREMVFVRQSRNHDYFRVMLMGKLGKEEEVETVIDEISICDDRQQYTDEFKKLLKDYYLYL